MHRFAHCREFFNLCRVVRNTEKKKKKKNRPRGCPMLSQPVTGRPVAHGQPGNVALAFVSSLREGMLGDDGL